MLALPAPASEDDKATVICCGVCFTQRPHPYEPAGRAFHACFEKPKIDAKKKGGPKKKEAEDSDDDREVSEKWKKKKRTNKDDSSSKTSGTLKLSHLLEGVDLYALLEVSESASTDQIKKSYRALALKHHPDKQGAVEAGADTSAAGLNEKEEHFVKIQEAYEVMSDQSKRRQYDSTLDFNDDIPEEVDPKLGYYGTFGPVFARNSRFSNRQPVPELGDEKTDIAKVHKFFDYWLDFDSWRDFSMHNEYNADDAEFREEKRWMEKQNQKIRKGYEVDERRRIMRLAERAERLDPRLKAEKEEILAKKREEKERRAQQKRDEEEAKRRVIEEKRKKEEQAKAEADEIERLEREKKKDVKQVQKDVNNVKKDVKQMQQAQKETQVQIAAIAGMLTKLVDNSSTQ